MWMFMQRIEKALLEKYNIPFLIRKDNISPIIIKDNILLIIQIL